MSIFSTDIKKEIRYFERIFNLDENIVVRKFLNGNGEVAFGIIYEKNMVNLKMITEGIILPTIRGDLFERMDENERFYQVYNNLFLTQKSSVHTCREDAIEEMLKGKTIILIDGVAKGIVAPSAGYERRRIGETNTEKVVRGPKEGFTESVSTNISMLRRRLPDERFKVINTEVGEISKTKVSICYIEGKANQDLVDEIVEKIKSIECEVIVESNSIAEHLEENRFSPFRTTGSTERPDEAVSKIIDGKVVLICSGTPFVLTVPHLFVEYFQIGEDNYNNYIFASLNRMLRIMAFWLTISIPAIYIALVTFHQEMIPTNLAMSVSKAREGVPFPTVVEGLIFLSIFEFLRESSTRMPYSIGSMVGVVGALVIGQAAVSAKLVSAPMIIIISFVGITTFLVTELKAASIIFRLIFMFCGATLGLYGYIFGLIGLVYYLTTIEAFGIPYLSRMNNIQWETLRKYIFRAPVILSKSRDEK